MKIKSNKEMLGKAYKFIKEKDNQKVILDGIFQVALNRQGLCTEFHMWWVVK